MDTKARIHNRHGRKVETAPLAPNTTRSIKKGMLIRVPLESTSARTLTVLYTGMTVEVNGVDLTRGKDGVWRSTGSMGGYQLNTAKRVPTAICQDSKGHLHAIHFWHYRWIGAYHRTLQFCREWEMRDGSDLTPEMAALADKALSR